MFKSLQDTNLLQGALISATKLVQTHESPKALILPGEKEVVEIVSSCIKIWNLHLFGGNEKKFKKQIFHQKRLHSAFLYTTLRSSKIECDEANTYYESVLHTFPEITWELYIMISYSCDWSSYFIESIQQLQPAIIETVLKKVLKIDWHEDELKFYCWHLSLQTLIYKFFISDDPSLSKTFDNNNFSFPFETKTQSNNLCPDNIQEYNRSKLLHTFETLLDRLSQSDSDCISHPDFIKLIFHAYKTIFHLLSQVNVPLGNCVPELIQLNPLFEMYYQEDNCYLRTFLDVPLDHSFEDISYCNASWETCGAYVAFMVDSHCEEVLRRTKLDVFFAEQVSSLMPFFNNTLKVLTKMDPLNLYPVDHRLHKKYVQMLKCILQYDYPGASYSACSVLRNQTLLASNEFSILLEEKYLLFTINENYKILAESILQVSQADLHSFLVKLFFTVLSQLPIKVYDEFIQWASDGQKCQFFRTADFDSQLDLITRKTLSFAEAMKCLPPLFIQSPDDVLTLVVEQALMQGEEGMALIQVLEFLPSACSYSGPDDLVKKLKQFLSEEVLCSLPEKNIFILLECILNVQSKASILPFDAFLNECIIPNLNIEHDSVELVLKCLKMSFSALVVEYIYLHTFRDIIFLMYDVLHYCVTFGHSRLKVSAVDALSSLETYQEITGILTDEHKDNIRRSFPNSSYHLFAQLYFCKLLDQEGLNDALLSEIKSTSSMVRRQLLLTWRVINQSPLPATGIDVENTPYVDLLNILTPVLAHFTKEEWQEVAEILQTVENLDVLAINLSEKDQSKLYPVVRCLTDCLYFLIARQCDVYDVNYLCSNFTNTIVNLLSTETSPPTLLSIFLDICHLPTQTFPELLDSLSSFLIILKQTVLKSSEEDKVLAKQYSDAMMCAVKCFPDTVEKTKLLQKL